MDKSKLKNIRRNRRRRGLRKRIVGTPEQPRLTVYRSLKHIYAQVVDDLSGKTLASANTMQLKVENGGNIASAKQVGQNVAEAARQVGVERVAFDRNGFRYHGRVKALADAAREAGLQF